MSDVSMATQEQEEVVELIEEFTDAAKRGDMKDAREIFAEIRELHDDVRRSENVIVEQARLARHTQDVTFEEQKRLSELIKAAARTAASRGQFHLAGGGVLEFADSFGEDDLDSSVEQVVNDEIDLAGRKQDVSPTIESAELPPQIAITELVGPPRTGDLDPGDAFEIEATVANVGDETARGIAVTLESPEQLAFDDSEATIDQLPAMEEESVEFVGEVGANGAFDVTVHADSDSAGTDAATATVAVLEDGLLESIQEDTPGWVPAALGGGVIAAGIGGYLRHQGSNDE